MTKTDGRLTVADYRKQLSRCKSNGWRIVEEARQGGGIRLNVVRRDGRPHTIRLDPDRVVS